MKERVLIGASLACADLRNLSLEIRLLEEAGVDYFHIDIMDGTFVPNFGLNVDYVNTLKDLTSLPIYTHLMINEPEKFTQTFIQAGSKAISIHQEATVHLQRSLSLIRGMNAKVGVALNPATPLNVLDYILDDLDMIIIMTVNPGFAGQKLIPSTLQKISALHALLQRKALDKIDIEVDGNVSFENIPIMVKSGATMLVGGTSSIFKPGIIKKEAVDLMRRLVLENKPAI
jgi:ribulose-phosphate 3-epimerase